MKEQKRKLSAILIPVFFLLSLSSCGFHKTALITSEPDKAEVYVDGNFAGNTPRSVEFLMNNEPFTYYEPVESPKEIKVVYEGYKPAMKVYNNIDRTKPIPKHLTHFVLIPLIECKKQNTPDSPFTKTEIGEAFQHRTFWRNGRKTRILLVGISEYKDFLIPKINNAKGDAQILRSFFEKSGVPSEHINSLLEENASRNDITDALSKLKMATTERNETAIFYFSGHGSPVVKNGKVVDGILIPYDAKESSLEYTGIKLSTLREMLNDVRGQWIIILDACFSGKAGRSIMAKNVKGIAIVPKNTAFLNPKENIWWLTATSGDNFANDFPKEGMGLFTYYFLQALNGGTGVDSNEDGLISLKESFEWTKEEVKDVSAKSLGRLQVPELIGKNDTVLTIPR